MVRVGAVGYGEFGAFVLRAIRELTGVQIYAVAGRHEKRLRSFTAAMDIPKWTTDWKSLVSDPKVDIVAILTPPYLRAEIALAAAENKKHLFVEKPLALTLREADTIIAAVQKAGTKAVVNFVMRYHPLYRWLKKHLPRLPLGRLRKVWLFNFASKTGLLPKHWFWDETKSGGILVEHGIHFYDLFTWLLDDPLEPIVTFGHPPFEAWSLVRFPHHEAFGSFYHCFDKPIALERTLGGIVFERGYVTFEGWLPLAIRIDCPSPQGTGAEERRLFIGKGELYRGLIQAAFRDLLQALHDPDHEISVDLRVARKALEIALKAKDLYRPITQIKGSSG